MTEAITDAVIELADPRDTEDTDILDEASQRSFDLASLYENIRVARSDLAAVKIQFYLSRGGVRGFEHPEQWRKLVGDKRAYLDALLRMCAEVEAGGAVPEPRTEPTRPVAAT